MQVTTLCLLHRVAWRSKLLVFSSFQVSVSSPLTPQVIFHAMEWSCHVGEAYDRGLWTSISFVFISLKLFWFSGVPSRKSPGPLTASYTGLTISPKFGIHVQQKISHSQKSLQLSGRFWHCNSTDGLSFLFQVLFVLSILWSPDMELFLLPPGPFSGTLHTLLTLGDWAD